MINHANFGDENHYLRCSHIDKIIRCPMRFVLSMDIGDEELGGKAAQTGQLVHKAAAAYHHDTGDEYRKLQAGLKELESSLPLFPDGEKTEALIHFKHYACDPRNIEADCVLIEHEMRMKLKPHYSDNTGKPIYIRGTIDQLRKVNGQLLTYDIKTGKPSGWEMVHDHAIQQAAYVILCRESGYDAKPGYIIRTYGYRARDAVLPSPEGVFWTLPFTIKQCYHLIDRIRIVVANIRNGDIAYGPSPLCTFCEHGGLAKCQNKAEEIFEFGDNTEIVLRDTVSSKH
jgi:hypothetical protein